MLRVFPVTLKEANALVSLWHRHHKPARGCRFCLGLYDTERSTWVGACIVGRPKARMTDQASVMEVDRLVTDGTLHACSKLYGAAARIAREMGAGSIQTFILETEPGTSLLGAGWTDSGLSTGGDWGRKSRPRSDEQPTCPKRKFVKVLCGEARPPFPLRTQR